MRFARIWDFCAPVMVLLFLVSPILGMVFPEQLSQNGWIPRCILGSWGDKERSFESVRRRFVGVGEEVHLLCDCLYRRV